MSTFDHTAEHAITVFGRAIKDYHQWDSVDHPIDNPFSPDTFDHCLYLKNWIDTVQWHYEDLIRVPNIDPTEGMTLKRKIDASNQFRTDIVEQIDDWFFDAFGKNKAAATSRLNTETPAWVLDRLSILCLKIWHMKEKACDTTSDATKEAARKLDVLQAQQKDLSTAFNELITDLKTGRVMMKVYRQMKMYNDPKHNPFLTNKPF